MNGRACRQLTVKTYLSLLFASYGTDVAATTHPTHLYLIGPPPHTRTHTHHTHTTHPAPHHAFVCCTTTCTRSRTRRWCGCTRLPAHDTHTRTRRHVGRDCAARSPPLSHCLMQTDGHHIFTTPLFSPSHAHGIHCVLLPSHLFGFTFRRAWLVVRRAAASLHR